MSHVPVRETEGQPRARKVTVRTLQEMKRQGQPITALTAYDYPTGKLVDEAGVDLVLVGDSVAMVALGHENTLALTMDEMVHHAKAVRRGVTQAFLAVDMPFGSFHMSEAATVENALRLVKEAGAEAVKLEGGRKRAELIARLTREEIPVVGHIGLTPQSVHQMSGYRVQGRSREEIDALVADAAAVESAGAVALVLEGVPRDVAAHVTKAAKIPVIGIGAGPECDGQILVFHDAFGLTFGAPAKFVRRFGDAGEAMRQGLDAYCDAVRARTFPNDAESYHLPAAVAEELEAAQ